MTSNLKHHPKIDKIITPSELVNCWKIVISMSNDTYNLRERAVEKYFGNESNYRNLCRKYLHTENYECEIYLDNQLVKEYGTKIKHSIDYNDRIMSFLKKDITERRNKYLSRIFVISILIVISILFIYVKFGFANLFAVVCVCGAFGALATTPIFYCKGK